MIRGTLVCIVVLVCVMACAMARPGGRGGRRPGGHPGGRGRPEGRPERPGNPEEQLGDRPGRRPHRGGPRPVLCYLSIDGNVTVDEPCAFQGELFECVEARRHHRPSSHSSEEDSDESDESVESFEFEEQSIEDLEDHQNITAKFCRPLNCTADSDCSGDNMCLAAAKGHQGGHHEGRRGDRRGGRRGGRSNTGSSDEEEPSEGRCEISCAQRVYASACLLTDVSGAVVRTSPCPPHLTCNTDHARTFQYQGATLSAHTCQHAGEFGFPEFDRCGGLKPENTTTIIIE